MVIPAIDEMIELFFAANQKQARRCGCQGPASEVQISLHAFLMQRGADKIYHLTERSISDSNQTRCEACLGVVP